MAFFRPVSRAPCSVSDVSLIQMISWLLLYIIIYIISSAEV